MTKQPGTPTAKELGFKQDSSTKSKRYRIIHLYYGSRMIVTTRLTLSQATATVAMITDLPGELFIEQVATVRYVPIRKIL